MHRPILAILPAMVLVAAVSMTHQGCAQSSDFDLNVHARSHATARDIGLPEYPGATPFKEKDSDSSSGDVGLFLNSFHFSLKVASFVTADSPDRVLAFYRKPLAKFGEVLECDHGKPVGTLTVTNSGLTCGEHKGGKDSVDVSSGGHELRAGTPEKFRIVGIDRTVNGKTKFGLVALEVPTSEDSK